MRGDNRSERANLRVFGHQLRSRNHSCPYHQRVDGVACQVTCVNLRGERSARCSASVAAGEFGSRWCAPRCHHHETGSLGYCLIGIWVLERNRCGVERLAQHCAAVHLAVLRVARACKAGVTVFRCRIRTGRNRLRSKCVHASAACSSAPFGRGFARHNATQIGFDRQGIDGSVFTLGVIHRSDFAAVIPNFVSSVAARFAQSNRGRSGGVWVLASRGGERCNGCHVGNNGETLAAWVVGARRAFTFHRAPHAIHAL